MSEDLSGLPAPPATERTTDVDGLPNLGKSNIVVVVAGIAIVVGMTALFGGTTFLLYLAWKAIT